MGYSLSSIFNTLSDLVLNETPKIIFGMGVSALVAGGVKYLRRHFSSCIEESSTVMKFDSNDTEHDDSEPVLLSFEKAVELRDRDKIFENFVRFDDYVLRMSA